MLGEIFLPMSHGSTPAAPRWSRMLAVWLFLKRTYLGTAIRAISQDRAIMPLMGVDAEPHLPDHLGARRRARRPRRLPAGPAVRRPPGDRPLLRPDHLPGLRARRPGQHGRRLRRRVHLRPVHLGRRLLLRAGMGLRDRVRVLHRCDVLAPAGPARRAAEAVVTGCTRRAARRSASACSPCRRSRASATIPAPPDPVPAVGVHLHQLVGDGPLRPGLLGHGAFLGIGAYGVAMLWNHFGISPWLGIPAAPPARRRWSRW